MSTDSADIEALRALEDEPHGYQLQRLSRRTNVVDLTDRRLREYVRSRLGNADRRGPIGVDVYACKIGKKQRQFGRTLAEAIGAAIKGVPA